MPCVLPGIKRDIGLEMQDENLKEAANEPEINISDIFSNREEVFEEKEKQEKEPEQKQEKEPEQRDREVEAPEDSTEEHVTEKQEKEPEQEQEKEPEQNAPETDYQQELEKAERRYKDSQKWGTEMRKKLAAYEKTIKKYVEAGSLTTEEAESLLDHTQAEEAPPEDESTYVKYAKIWDEGVERIREFADDPKEIDKYVHAFQQLWRDSAPVEQEALLEEFSELGDNKASLTRKMIKMGKEYYDEVFGEVYESGSIRNFKKKFSEKEKEYNKRIDKLQKEVDKYKKKYEDYTDPTYRLPSGGSDNSMDTTNYSTDVKEIFSNR